MKDTFEACY